MKIYRGVARPSRVFARVNGDEGITFPDTTVGTDCFQEICAAATG
ncbi:hypothetical protein [Streptomyces sp. NPDC046976]